MIITVISMYRADDAEQFIQVVNGQLTLEQRQAWRKAHNCDEFSLKEDAEDEEENETDDMYPLEINNMYFREIKAADFANPDTPIDLIHIDGESDDGS